MGEKEITASYLPFILNITLKKRILILIGIGILLFGFWFYKYQTFIRPPFVKLEPMEAIPTNTPLFFKFDDFFKLKKDLTKMPYSNDFEGAFFVKKMSEDFNSIRRVFSKTRTHRRLLLHTPIYAAFQLSGKADADFLYVIQDSDGLFNLEDILKQNSYQEFKSNGHIVYELSLKDGHHCALAYHKGIVLLARYGFLVENGVQQATNYSDNLLKNQSIKQILEGRNSNLDLDLEAYLLLENIPEFITPFVIGKWRKQTQQLVERAGAIRLNIDFKEEGISFNGWWVKRDGGNKFKFTDADSSINHSALKNILPEDLVWFVNSILGGEYDLAKKDQGEIFSSYFKPWIDDEWAYGLSEVFSKRIESEQFVLYKAREPKIAQYYLNKLADSVGILKTLDYLTYPIRQIGLEELPSFTNTKEDLVLYQPFYTIIENYIVFSASYQSLEKWIDRYLTGQTLASNEAYLKMDSRLTLPSHGEAYWNTKNAIPLLKLLTKKALLPDLEKQLKGWEKMKPFGVQLVHHEKGIEINGLVSYQEKEQNRASVKWRVALDDEAITSPAIAFNETKQDYQILIQDRTHRLYLIDSKGEVEWKLLLDNEPVISDIVTADISGNEEWSWIFNTRKHIYAIDQEGEIEDGFPIPLPVNATNGLLLAEFGKDDYGLFVAGEDGNVYGYEKDASPIIGWNPLEDVGEIQHPLQHFQYEQEDYLVMFNEDGGMISVGREGQIKMDGLNMGGRMEVPLCFQLEESSPQMVLADAGGGIHQIGINEKELHMTMKVSRRKKFQYGFGDLTGDTHQDYYLLDKNHLEVYYYSENGFKSLSKYRFPSPPNDIFSVGRIEGKKNMIGSLHKEKQQIYLLNADGELHPDFPLAGTTSFKMVPMFSSNKEVVVVGHENQVVVYELP